MKAIDALPHNRRGRVHRLPFGAAASRRGGIASAGVDGFTPYYDVALKRARWALLESSPNFRAHEAMLEDYAALGAIAREGAPDVFVHLAAQAGVRYSLENPRAYADANLTGAFNVLEIVRETRPRHFLFASTSSVYRRQRRHALSRDGPRRPSANALRGEQESGRRHGARLRASPSDPDYRLSFLHRLRAVGPARHGALQVRRRGASGEPIDVYGEGKMSRDFTLSTTSSKRLSGSSIARPAKARRSGHRFPFARGAYRVVNVGGGLSGRAPGFHRSDRGEPRMPITAAWFRCKGDVRATWAAPDLLHALTGYVPTTRFNAGVAAFVAWRRERLGR